MQMRPVPAWFAACLACLVAVEAAAEPPDFDRDVAPILAGRCLDCHSGAEPKGGFDLAGREKATKGGESGEAAIIAGKPNGSPLWQRVADDEMPPKHPLPAKEKVVLKAWIESGAAWGADPIDPFRYTSAARAGYDWWSIQPLKQPPPPEIHIPQSAIHSPIDHFILANLEERGLSPSPPADRRTLLRRVSFDLTGLPPTPEEIDAFVNDPTADADAFARVVNRLLESPAYGERWARHWLDVAHFGESDGFEFDRMRPNAWRYRDWVIDAFNRDMPYDEFACLQIAGDVLRPDDAEATVATGFLVGGAHDGLMPKSEVMLAIMRHDELEDIVGTVGQTFLGLTVHCARCHDHKFDPVRQADYYRLASALSGVKRGNRDIPLQPPAEIVKAHDEVAKELSAIVREAHQTIMARRRSAASEQPAPPEPLARWDFDHNLNDVVGGLHAAAHGEARLESGALLLDGKQAYAATAPLEMALAEKTLEAWVQLDSLEQRGGAAIGVQSLDGSVFDAIVFGEKEPRRWIAGSDHFRRSQPLAEATDESDAATRFVHLAVVYHADGRISAYRDGQPYGQEYPSSGLVKFDSGKSQVVFGLRHSPAGGNKMLIGKIDRARLYSRALTADEVAASAGTIRTYISEEELDAGLDEPKRARREHLAAELARLGSEIQSYKDRKTFAVTPQEAPIGHILVRGNPQQRGEVVSPAGIAALGQAAEFGLPPNASDAERRMRLAAWIASESNPLFARTMANRLWHYHFGSGLIETPNDLGFSGGQPSHPELLDWLAGELIRERWSLKALHRKIVLSATYQQASRPRSECAAADADNRLLWRYSPRRLEAEAIRDAMLSVSGKLNPAQGGPSFMDFRPYEYKSAQYYEPLDSDDPAVQRRSIYRFGARGGRNPLLDAFDCPDPSTTTPKRGVTTTPLQALALYNNSFTLRMADGLVERLQKAQPASIADQVRLAFELTTARPPNSSELSVSTEFVKAHGLPAFCRVLLNTNGFLYLN